MFRRTRILQVACLLLALSGCASGSGPKGTVTMNGNAPGPNPPEAAGNRAAPALQAARPPASVGNFVDASGRLLPEVRSFANDTARSRSVPLPWAEALLREARYDAQAARLIAPPGRTGRIRRAWTSYRQRHVDPIRIRQGAQFWQDHRATLDRVYRATGVPQSIIVAIIGIETVYGRYTGNHRVLDTLATLGFRYPDAGRPERQKMFREQLADLLVLDYEHKLDARTVQGSFAGAMGLPQFMPGSLMRFAVDGDGDGRIDLQNSTDDAIASVANFLLAHGWQADVPVFAPVSLPVTAHALAQDGMIPQTTWPALRAAGARAKAGASGTRWQSQPLGVIDLQDEIRNTHDYRCATPNFFAITHYNRSYFYAASVADLAQAITERVAAAGPDRVSQTPR